MIGFVIGTVALVGLVRMVARRRFGARFGGYRDGAFSRGGRGGGGPVRALFAQLDTTPGQEKVILAAIDEARGAMRSSRGELNDSRKDLIAAVRAEHFDPLLLEGTFGRHDERIASLRGTLTGVLARVHEALDPEQRTKLAGLIRNGLGTGARPSAPLAATPVRDMGDVMMA